MNIWGENVKIEEENDTKPSKSNYFTSKKMKKHIFHPGSISLYLKDGKTRVLADIDHLHHKCREGLIDNIGFLYGMMCELKSTGYNVIVVGKVFNDDLYIYVSGRIIEDKILYRRFTLNVFDNLNSIDCFERASWYMQSMDEETVMEVVEKVKKYMGLA
jgi:hypothetical protein